MKNNIDLKNDSVKKLFLHYLFPSVTAMLVKSVHIVLDGIFIGNGVNANGLAAVNVSMPFFSLFGAMLMLFGVGGATLVSIKMGEEKPEQANAVFSFVLTFVVLLSLLCMAVSFAFVDRIGYLLGANSAIIAHVTEYISMLIAFALPFALSVVLAIFVRNDGGPKFSMMAMIVSALLNAGLNYLFIFPLQMGLRGAALATGIAESLSAVLLLGYFVFKRGKLAFKIKQIAAGASAILRITAVGFPSFLGEISFGVISLAFNRLLMHHGGEMAVAAYAIMMYVTTLVFMVFFGIGQAVQPIISFNYGAALMQRVKQSLSLAVKTSLGIGVVTALCGIIFVRPIVMLFNVNTPMYFKMAKTACQLGFVSAAFGGVNICISTYYQAIGNARVSIALAMFRGLIGALIVLFALSALFGLMGIWLTWPVSEGISFIISLLCLRQIHHKWKEDDRLSTGQAQLSEMQ